MSDLLCIARLKIHHGKLDEFKHLAARCVELVRTKDTGTLQYELYFNSDNTECLVFKRYRDSQALLDHHKNLGDTMAAILRTCSGSGKICGTPSPELIEQLKDSPIQVYEPFQANPGNVNETHEHAGEFKEPYTA
jgi:quinol monooxygenase YgiN